MASISFKNVVKQYGTGKSAVKVLHGIDAEINDHEFIVIVGPSGCGKSTLLNILGCLDRPTSGHYFLGGEDVSQMDDDLLSAVRGARLGFIF